MGRKTWHACTRHVNSGSAAALWGRAGKKLISIGGACPPPGIIVSPFMKSKIDSNFLTSYIKPRPLSDVEVSVSTPITLEHFTQFELTSISSNFRLQTSKVTHAQKQKCLPLQFQPRSKRASTRPKSSMCNWAPRACGSPPQSWVRWGLAVNSGWVRLWRKKRDCRF
jgi:hypothetical protein